MPGGVGGGHWNVRETPEYEDRDSSVWEWTERQGYHRKRVVYNFFIDTIENAMTHNLSHTPLAGFEEFGAGECESSQSSDFWDLGRRFGSSKTNKLVCEQQCKSNECCIAYGINPDDYDNRCYWYDGCAQSATVDKTAGVSVYGKYRSARCYRKIPSHRPPPPVSPNVLDEVEDGMEKDDLGLEIPNQTPTGTSLPTGPNVLDDPVPPPSDGISQLQITGITFLLGLVVYIIIKKNNSKRVQY